MVRPGELVFVVAMFGTGSPVNRPPGSVVGIESFRKRPHRLNFSLKVWSIRISSCLALKMLRRGETREFVPGAPEGTLLKMSLMYDAATGLMFVICVAV